MNASITDTAELPASPPPVRVTLLEDVSQLHLSPSRTAGRRERRQRRRQRRLYAVGSVVALMAVLGVTIYVVDVVR